MTRVHEFPGIARRLLRRAVYSTSLGRQSMAWRGLPKLVKLNRNWSLEIVELFQRDPSHVFTVEYDNSTSPPTYGDLFQVLMLARYLSLSGLCVEFFLLDYDKRRSDWMDLTPAEQAHFVLEQRSLARVLLPDNVPIHLVAHPSDLASSSIGDAHRILGHLVDRREPIYPWCPSLLHEFISQELLPWPNTFLLDQATVSLEAVPEPEGVAPYIAWHIRQGKWDSGRDTTDRAMIQDFLELRAVYPQHSIMLISSPEGVARGLSVLEEANLTRPLKEAGLSVMGQPTFGFFAAMHCVLGADFYFQRLGGGIGMVPIFSTMPYLILSRDGNYYHRRVGNKLVPWANEKQRYIVAPREVSVLTITSELRAQ